MHALLSLVLALQVTRPELVPFAATCSGVAATGNDGAERTVPFQPGETLEYDVERVAAVPVATATVSVAGKGSSCGSPAYRIVARGEPVPFLAKLYRVRYDAGALVDARTLLPHTAAVFSEEWKRTRLKTTLFDRGARTARFEMVTKTRMKKDLPGAAGDLYDPLSAIFALRAMPLEAGSTMTLRVTDSGWIYDLALSIGAAEVVRTGLGDMRAHRIAALVRQDQPKRSTRRIVLWLSDDGRRLPVQLTAELWFGALTFRLRSVAPQ